MAGLVAFLCLAIGAVAWLAFRPETYVAPPPTAAHPSARPDLAEDALTVLSDAVAARDQSAAARLASGPAARSWLHAVISNAARLDVTGFTARYVDESGPVAAGGGWTASVDLTWRFGRYDPGPLREEVDLGFAEAGGRVHIAGVAGSGRTPLWLTGPVRVEKRGETLVLGTDGAAVERFAPMAARTLPIVGRVVTGWKGPLVVEVPASESALDQALDTADGTYSGVAAVTASVDGSTSPSAPIHVFLNPEVMRRLNRQGAQIVLSHEATHAATKAATNSRRPIWLTEGFADYVALREVHLPLTTTAGQIIAQVRKNGPPDHLPDQSDFDSHSASFGAEYEAAWLACRLIAERAGQRGLVDLYDRVGAGQDLDSSLRHVLGVGTRGLTHMWRSRLSDLAA